MNDHYFTNNSVKSNEVDITSMVCGHKVILKTDNGVFSKSHVDSISIILIENIINDFTGSSILDLGCGYGVIGITLAKHFDIKVDFVDINERAVELTAKNIELNNVKGNVSISDMFDKIEDSYDAIALNPPIRAGKTVCYKMYYEARDYLNHNGALYIVISKKHGAKSTITYLETIYSKIDVLHKNKGVFVLKCTKE